LILLPPRATQSRSSAASDVYKRQTSASCHSERAERRKRNLLSPCSATAHVETAASPVSGAKRRPYIRIKFFWPDLKSKSLENKELRLRTPPPVWLKSVF